MNSHELSHKYPTSIPQGWVGLIPSKVKVYQVVLSIKISDYVDFISDWLSLDGIVTNTSVDKCDTCVLFRSVIGIK